MAYDNESDRVILFGGETSPGSRVLNDETWAYSVNSNTWENRNPNSGPSSRFADSIAYDARSDRVILFGGLPGSHETWAYDYDTNAWTNVTSAISPPAGVAAEMAYDAESDRIILFGGGMDEALGGLSAETWAYDFDSNTWTRRNPTVSPASRWGPMMAYDEESDRIVLFGGRDGQHDFGDTWVYDYNSDTWRRMNPATAPTAPTPRHGAAMAYDAGSDGVILFGGVTVTGDTAGGDETWVYHLNSDTWIMVEKGSGPSSRFGEGMAYDTESDRVVLFGGSFQGDETWSHRFFASPPPFPWAYVAAGVAIAAIGTVVAAFAIRRRSRKRIEGK